MPNGAVHSALGMATGVGACLLDTKSQDVPVINPLTAALIGTAFGKLPDILEPAIHSHHRQFFHSFAALGTLIYGLKKAYNWEPDTNLKKLIRGVLLIGGVSYAGHLVVDSLTARSLPVIGRL